MKHFDLAEQYYDIIDIVLQCYISDKILKIVCMMTPLLARKEYSSVNIAQVCTILEKGDLGTSTFNIKNIFFVTHFIFV